MIGRESFDQRSPKQVFEDDVRSLMTEVTDPDTNKKSYMLAPGKTMYDAAAVLGAGEAHSIKDSVTDMRISRSESKDGARRERKSVDDLIRAETGEASRKYHEKWKMRELDKTSDMIRRGVL